MKEVLDDIQKVEIEERANSDDYEGILMLK